MQKIANELDYAVKGKWQKWLIRLTSPVFYAYLIGFYLAVILLTIWLIIKIRGDDNYYNNF